MARSTTNSIWAMINQKAIPLKLYSNLVDELDKEASVTGYKRNRIINDAVSLYLKAADTRRRIRAYTSLDDKQWELRKFLEQWLPETQYW